MRALFLRTTHFCKNLSQKNYFGQVGFELSVLFTDKYWRNTVVMERSTRKTVVQLK